MTTTDISNANISRVLRKAALMIDAKSGGSRKGFSELNFAENELRAIARALDTQAIADPTPTVIVYVHGGVVQDMDFSSVPVRVVVVDSDVDNEDEETEVSHPDGTTFRAWVSVWDGSLLDESMKARVALVLKAAASR